MDNPFKPESHDTGTGNRSYRHARREQRRARRRNLTLYIMLAVMAAALLISLYNTFTPHRPTPTENVKTSGNIFPDDLLNKIDSVTARLDGLMRTCFPDDTLWAEKMIPDRPVHRHAGKPDKQESE